MRVVGVVDELPTRVGDGWRFALRIEACDRLGESARPPRGARPVDPTSRSGGADDAGQAVRGGARPRHSGDAQQAAARPVDPFASGGSGAEGAEATDASSPQPADEAARASPRPSDPSATSSAIAIDTGPCPLPGRLQLSWHGSGRGPPVPPLLPGERWSLEVSLRRPHAPINFGAFDRELRWLHEGIGAVGSVRRGTRVAGPVAGPAIAIERARAAIRDGVLRASGERAREAGVLAALAVGDQAAIDPTLWTLFNVTGTGHLVSISGLHVTMLAGLAGAAVRRAWTAAPLRALGLAARVSAPSAGLAAAAVTALGYAALAGWGVPAQRTGLMLCAAAVLLVTRRAASIGTAIAAAAAVVVLADPWAPLAAGFWLSFGAVAAIVWACTGMPSRVRGARAVLAAAVRTQWAATIALVPLGAWFFGSVSLVGPLANAVAIPVVGFVVTPLALAGGALAPVSGSLASLVLAPAAAVLGTLIAALEALAAVPHAAVSLPRPDLAALIVASAGCALLLAPRGMPARALGALALLPIAAVPLPRPKPGELRLTALDVGQGSAAVVQVGRRTLLYDTGPGARTGSDAGARVVVPWLRAQGIGALDALVVSHVDDDHAGGAASVLAAVPAARLVSSIRDDHALVRAHAGEPCRRGEGWRWDDVEFEFLHPADPPEPARGSATNASSCVLRIRAPGGAVLLAGDIEAAQERRLVELFGAAGLGAEVLLVPHHGSRTSSTGAFLDAVAPRRAIVQHAYRSRYGHPHPTVVARFEARGIELLRSDADGAVQLRLAAGREPVVLRARRAPERYWRVPVPP
ncbi:MAG TPA: DNA internalization-related competence protein ComEC/Rec2 [Burkholderiaceae bacterium]|nr:DNA internalization-related competence protein ComEC/Rec2 [Burkholderiaceae bacterium]